MLHTAPRRNLVWAEDIDPQVAQSMLGDWPQCHRPHTVPEHMLADWPTNQPASEPDWQHVTFDAGHASSQSDSSQLDFTDAAQSNGANPRTPEASEDSHAHLEPLIVEQDVYAGQTWAPQSVEAQNDDADASTGYAAIDWSAAGQPDAGRSGAGDYGAQRSDVELSAVASAQGANPTVPLNAANYLANDAADDGLDGGVAHDGSRVTGGAANGIMIHAHIAHAGAANGNAAGNNAMSGTVGNGTVGNGTASNGTASNGTVANGAAVNGTAANTRVARAISQDAAALRTDAHYRLSRLPAQYHVFNDAALPSDGERLDFDQLVIAPSGVFIVSIMPLDGRIYGDAQSPNWAVVPYGSPVTPDEARACAQGTAVTAAQGIELVANPMRRNEWLVEGTARMMGLPAEVFHCAVLVPPTARPYLSDHDDASLVITPTQEAAWIQSMTEPALDEGYVADLSKALEDYLKG